MYTVQILAVSKLHFVYKPLLSKYFYMKASKVRVLKFPNIFDFQENTHPVHVNNKGE